MQPDGYAGGSGEHSRIEQAEMPAPMRADVGRWLEDFPKATLFVTRLYAEER